MKETAQTEEAPTIEINSQATNDLKNIGQKICFRILHVDDDLCLLEVSKQILEMENNFEIDVAVSVDEAFKRMETQTYDAVVSDYEMPLKNGLDFLRELREQQKDVPFILFTGKGREEVVVEALNLGADSYINKNGSPATVYCELADAINKTVERKKARELLAASESKYRTLVEKSLQGIIITVTDPLNLVFSNEAMGKILGYSVKELMSLSPEGIMSLVYHEDRAVFFKRMENRLRGEPGESCYEFRAVRKDGSIIWLNAFANRVEYDGQPAVQGMFLDVTERKIAEEEMRKSELILQNSSDSIIVTDLQGKITVWNKGASDIFGYSAQEMLGENITKIVKPLDKEQFAPAQIEAIRKGQVFADEWEGIRKDGPPVWLILTTTLLKNSQNEPVGIVGFGKDVTEHRKAVEALRMSEKRMSSVLAASPDAIIIFDLNGQIIDCNQSTVALHGYRSKEEAVGKNILEHVAKKDRERALKGMAQGLVKNLEITFVAKDGREYPVEVSGNVVLDALGKPAYFMAITKDITERKKTELELMDLAKFPSENPNPILRVSKDNLVLYANPASKSLLKGLNVEIGQPSPRFLIQPIATALASGLRQEAKCEANQREFLFTIAPIKAASYVNVYGLDITERTKAEKALQESEGKLRAIFEGASDGIIVADLRTRSFVFANPRICEITGYSLEELLKMNVSDIHPEQDLPSVIDQFTMQVQGEMTLATDVPVLRKDRTIVYCDISARPAKIGEQEYLIGFFRDITERKKAEQAVSASLKRYQSFIEVTGELGWTTNAAGEVDEDVPSFRNFTGQSYDEVKGCGWTKAVHPDDLEHAMQAWQAAVAAKTNYEVEYRLRRRDGVYRNFMVRGAPIFEENGKIREWVGTCIDITDRKNAEEILNRTMDEMVRVNEKLNVVGSLTRHDVRNKLCAVTANAYILKKKHPDQLDIIDGLGKMEQAVKDIVKIFDFAKTYEQLGIEKLTYIDLEKTLDESVSLFSGLFNVEVINDCHGLTLLADSFLRQLFYNLIDNSLKHGEKVTRIRVHYEKVDQDKLNVVYEDDGVGISALNKPRLFKEGFSTGGSSGYGLYLIKKMIEVYGWDIQENGEPDKGARFTIKILRINQEGKENFQIAQ